MKDCWLLPLLAVLAWTALVRGGPMQRERRLGTICSPDQVGFLIPGQGGLAIPYHPQPGDIILYDDHDRFHYLAYKIAGTGPPTHTAMVYARDGKPVLLELTGPTVARARVVTVEVGQRLQSYPGSIMVRRLRQPLEEEQVESLAHFASSQEGRAFALPRIVLQITPFRCRTGLRRQLFGHTYMDRKRWLCSEMVVSAASAAHLLDPKKYAANGIYPRDLAYDETVNLSSLYEPPISWVPNLAGAQSQPTGQPGGYEVSSEAP